MKDTLMEMPVMESLSEQTLKSVNGGQHHCGGDDCDYDGYGWERGGYGWERGGYGWERCGFRRGRHGFGRGHGWGRDCGW